MKGIASNTAQAAFAAQANDLLGPDVFDEGGNLTKENVQKILLPDWDDRLKRGNRDVLNPDYLPDLERRLTGQVTEEVRKNVKLFLRKKKKIVGSAVEQSFQQKSKYVLLHEREQQLKQAVEILEFLVNLPEEEIFEVDGEVIGVAHTVYTNEVDPERSRETLYVADPITLAYFDKVEESKSGEGYRFNREKAIMPQEIFKLDRFKEVDTWFFGHVHTDEEYKGAGNARGKKIITLPSPFERDGKGVRAPIRIYHAGRGRRKMEKVDLEYDNRETERKVRVVNPRFLDQIKLWRGVNR